MQFKRIKQFFALFKNSAIFFSDYNGMKLSAALSYYTVFALGPFLIVIISLAGIFFGREAVQGKVYDQISGLVGPDAALQVQSIIQNIQQSHHGAIGGVIAFIVLLIGASGVFSEIQGSLNYLWAIHPKNKKGIVLFLFRRLLSFSLLISVAFILMVSLIVNALIDVLSTRLKAYIPESVVDFVYAVNIVLILFIITVLFTLIFKILPNAIIRWRDAAVGASVTAFLFLIGKFIIGLYLGNSKIGATYGTTASIVILMLWVYYSSIILYFGAAFTRVYAEFVGRSILSR